MKSPAFKIAYTGLLGALAILLSFLEGMLPPLPLLPPGAKLGLSNVVTMYCASALGLPAALCLTLLKSGFALLTRGVTAGLMSCAGGLLSTVVLWLLLKKTKSSLLFSAVCAALSHNAGQLIIAYFLTSYGVLALVPYLLLFGVLTGALTGLVLQLVSPHLERLQSRLYR